MDRRCASVQGLPQSIFTLEVWGRNQLVDRVMEPSLLTSIDAVVGDGRATISADDSVIVDIVKETIRSGRTASFYLPQDQAEAVKAWYWTSERIKSSNIRVALEEERTRCSFVPTPRFVSSVQTAGKCWAT